MGAENDNTKKESIFGVKPDSFQTYALIHISWDLEEELGKEITKMGLGGGYLTIQDGDNGFGNGFIFDLSAEEIISLAPRYGIDRFIYGADTTPSTPYFYQKTKNGLFEAKQLEPIISKWDLEEIAPKCSDVWEDLFLNDYFLESLESRYGSTFDDDED